MELARFSFYVCLLFINFSSFKLDTKIMRILALYQANVPTLMPFGKEDKILIKNL